MALMLGDAALMSQASWAASSMYLHGVVGQKLLPAWLGQLDHAATVSRLEGDQT